MAGPESSILWSPEAIDDVDRLWNYYADAAGQKTADKVLRAVAKTVAAIRDFPLAGRQREELRAGLRSIAAGSQVVFYRLNGDRPEIVRVLDGRRDIEDIFTEDDPPQNAP